MPKNFFITGSRDCGKTTLVKLLLDTIKTDISGFETIPYYIDTQIKGHYFHSLVTVEETQNNLPFTLRHKKNACLTVNEVFMLLGVPCLKESIKNKSRLIVMDEIGTIESNCPAFLEAIENALNSEKVVLAVIKKSNSFHLNKIISHRDSMLIDLDTTSKDEAFKICSSKMKEALNEKK